MEHKFKSHITTHFPEFYSGHLLIAVSGGVDSMVLCDLCLQADLSFSIAHCNFNLRDEAKGDQNFVAAYAKQHDIKYHTISFNTENFAKTHKLSTQIAARELRYNWFHQLLEEQAYTYLLTAHHLNDQLETFLINLSRGSGIKGLTGIPAQNEAIKRPLLNFTKSDILNYAKAKDLKWREDASNQSTYYLRNQVRHQVIPKLEGLAPHFLSSFQDSLHYLQQSNRILEAYVLQLKAQLITSTAQSKTLDLVALRELDQHRDLLFYLLQEFGFTHANDLLNLLDAETGKFVESASHRIVKDRDTFIIYKQTNLTEFKVVNYESLEALMQNNDEHLKASVEAYQQPNSPYEVFIDLDQLQFPLRLRPVQTTDYFKPLGMNGIKKVVHFLRDQKVPTFEKSQQLILEDQHQIVWVVGHRINDNYKLTKTTQHNLKLIWQN